MITPMPRTTLRALFGALILILLLGAASQAAAAQKTVLILPFQVNAMEPLSELERQIPSVIRDALEKRGHEVLPLAQAKELLDDPSQGSPDLETVRDLIRVTGATYAVYGSLTQAGEWIGLDARVAHADAAGKHPMVSVSRKGQDHLLPAVEELANRIASVLVPKERVSSIEVTGNDRLNAEAVLQRIQTREGEPYDPKRIDRDIRRLYESGYFENITVRERDLPDGKKIVYEVEERPQIEEIVIKGAKALDREELLEAMSSESGNILNPETISQDLEAVRELYRKDGYYSVNVDYASEKIDTGQVKLIVRIEEGKKRYIQKIRIKGADKLDPGQLKDQLALSERGFFSWFTGGGVLKERMLNRDAAALEAYYANRGFVDVKVGQPDVESVENGLRITFRVREGARYRLGEIGFQGDLILSEEELMDKIRIDDMARNDAYFDRSVLREDTRGLEEFYQKYGYAFAQADPRLNKNRQNRTIDVTYSVSKERKVYIDRVRITGNTKTRDRIIRRNLAISGGDLFDSDKISRSKQNLQRLDYFKSVEIDTIPGREPGEMDLQVQVQDKPTGSFSLGAGYSTVNKLFFTGKVQERNFLGRGYNLSFQGSFSSTQTQYQVSFWNPRLYDSSLGLGFDAYNSRREYDDYKLERTGGKAKFAYTIGDHTRLFWNYNLEEYRVYDIDSTASDAIQDIDGTNWSSAANVSAVRDTTNRRLYPTRGSKNTLTVEYSGGPLGGDDNFVKPSYELTMYQSLVADFVFSWHGKYAHLFENTSEPVPDFERFYLGGINTVRGYDYQDIASEDDAGKKVGGYKQFYTNTEISYPLIKDMGLQFLVFFDAGNVWNKDEHPDDNLYKSVGAGIRWNSPMGPLRLEYGYPLDKIEGERQEGQFEFSVGQAF
ncbi:MAG: outer membrane protein assembly factor BamA [Desulfohalobiaceae bacterium]